MQRIVIFGTGGGAQVLRAYLQADPGRTVVAFTSDRRFVTEPQFDGLPLFPFDEIEAHCPPSSHALLLAVGYIDRNRVRARVFDEALAKGYELESFIDPSVTRHGSTRIGRGCLICDGVSIQPFAEIGDNVVIRPQVYVGHHAVVGAHTFLAPQAALLGYSRIGEFGFVGAHATVSSRVTIGPHSVVSASAVVTRDLPANSIVRGPGSAGAGRRREPGGD